MEGRGIKISWNCYKCGAQFVKGTSRVQAQFCPECITTYVNEEELQAAAKAAEEARASRQLNSDAKHVGDAAMHFVSSLPCAAGSAGCSGVLQPWHAEPPAVAALGHRLDPGHVRRVTLRFTGSSEAWVGSPRPRPQCSCRSLVCASCSSLLMPELGAGAAARVAHR